MWIRQGYNNDGDNDDNEGSEKKHQPNHPTNNAIQPRGKKYAKQMEMEIENKPANTKDGGGEKI